MALNSGVVSSAALDARLAGNRTVNEQQHVLPAEVLKSLPRRLALRLNSPDVTRQFDREVMLLIHVWAWRDISGPESKRAWFLDVISEDEKFLKLLLVLCYGGTSSATGFYLAMNLSQLRAFLGSEEQIKSRQTETEGWQLQ